MLRPMNVERPAERSAARERESAGRSSRMSIVGGGGQPFRVLQPPTRQREVIVARYYLGLTERQTAELLHVGLGTVKRHAHRALAALECRMEAPS